MPGAGKTILTAIVIEHLWDVVGHKPDVGIAYVYISYRRQLEQKPVDLLGNLLKQLIQNRASVPESVKELYKCHEHNKSRPSLKEVRSALEFIIKTYYSKTFIVIDALDEYLASDGSCWVFLSEILRFQSSSTVNIFATSRFNPEIQKEFENRGGKTVEIRASDEDIQSYLKQNLAKMPNLARYSDLSGRIMCAITKAVDGMCVILFVTCTCLIV